MLRRHTVLLIHGINSWGSWYDTANDVLGHHFHCKFYRFTEYRRFGFLRVIMSLRGLALTSLAVAAVIAADWNGKIGLVMTVSLIGALVGLFVWYGISHAIQRRNQRIHRLAEVIDTLGSNRPHIIAHSYGTYLVSRVLTDYVQHGAASVSHGVNRIIFWGAVVDSKFPWDSILRSRRARYIRNDVGRRDRVVTFVQRSQKLSLGLLYRLVPGLGDAGLAGFANPKLNAVFPFDHSTALQDNYAAIARYYWLPYLWGNDPEKHALFCNELIAAGERSQLAGYRGRHEFNELLQMSFDWTNSNGSQCVLGEFITGLRHSLGLATALPNIRDDSFQRYVCVYMDYVSRHQDVRVIEPYELVSTSVEKVTAILQRRR